MSAQEHLNNYVFQLRSDRGVTQESLAETVGVSRQTIISIEKGNYAPSVHLALKIASFFKVPLEKVFNITYEK